MLSGGKLLDESSQVADHAIQISGWMYSYLYVPVHCVSKKCPKFDWL